MESVFKTEKTVDKYGNQTSRLNYVKGKFDNGIFMERKYDKCNNWIERKIFNDQQIVLSLVKKNRVIKCMVQIASAIFLQICNSLS